MRKLAEQHLEIVIWRKPSQKRNDLAVKYLIIVARMNDTRASFSQIYQLRGKFRWKRTVTDTPTRNRDRSRNRAMAIRLFNSERTSTFVTSIYGFRLTLDTL